MRYLLTGGAGFIGSHLAEALRRAGHEVVILDDLSTGSYANVAELVECGGAEFVEGSVTDLALVDELMRGVDICVHLASVLGVQRIVARPLDALLTNVRSCDVVMEAAAQHGVRVLFTSTSEVYGKESEGALSEDADLRLGSPFTARWSYAIAKTLGESLAHCYARDVGAEVVVVRLFNTVGARQTGRHGMVLPRFVRQALAGEDVTVFGDGRQTRCFTHVSDTVDALCKLCEEPRAAGRVYNIGNPDPFSIMELALRVIDRADSASHIAVVPYEDAYAPGFEELGARRPDISRLVALTGWRPRHGVDDAIDDVIAFERARVPSAAPAMVADAA